MREGGRFCCWLGGRGGGWGGAGEGGAALRGGLAGGGVAVGCWIGEGAGWDRGDWWGGGGR